ncbi:riboflavin synthase [uncultured Clostridium sp.]|uniref:riboflavin synthase n=1 Tax=uncultured Clostridium sp. TaxID=59620 RepID=UPI0025D6DD41|nr:riboflavin synthase [uncultured Clostridium sp.]
MFTGIIEEVGVIKELRTGNGFGNIEIKCRKVLEDTELGDSIAVNGVCLTVSELKDDCFTADIMGETLDKTNLGELRCGSRVNLERALRLSGRFGGHIVSGHIDGNGRIISIEKKDDGTWFTISADKHILKYVIYKGSITIDGISLTVAYADNKVFKVSVIPHTLENTILTDKTTGSVVNLENDVIGKYVEKLFNNGTDSSQNEKSNITMEFLMKNGF